MLELAWSGRFPSDKYKSVYCIDREVGNSTCTLWLVLGNTGLGTKNSKDFVFEFRNFTAQLLTSVNAQVGKLGSLNFVFYNYLGPIKRQNRQ